MRNAISRSASTPFVTACALGLCLVLAGCASAPRGTAGTDIGTHMAATTPTRAAIMQAAAAQLGDAYQHAANGPRAFSDNGLVQYAYARAGIELPMAPHALLGAGPPVAMTAAKPGDLVFYQTHMAGGATSLRVGLYLNTDEMLYASAKQGRVIIQSIDSDYWTGRLLGVVQVLH